MGDHGGRKMMVEDFGHGGLVPSAKDWSSRPVHAFLVLSDLTMT